MNSEILDELARVLESRKGENADDSYVASLYAKGINKILEKVGEEATEVILAAKDGDRTEVVKETADLWFHCMVLLSQLDVSHQDVLSELERRFGTSGHDEKASRSR